MAAFATVAGSSCRGSLSSSAASAIGSTKMAALTTRVVGIALHRLCCKRRSEWAAAASGDDGG